jgi:hypothetical protein
MKYEHGSLPTVTGHSWHCKNAVVAAANVAPVADKMDLRPFQAIARVLRDHPEYSKEWASYLCGFYDDQGFKEITLEYWLAYRPKPKGHVHNRTCRRSCKKIEDAKSKVSEREQDSLSDFPGQCRPKAGDMISVRRHRTLEVMWHRILRIDEVLVPGSISTTQLLDVPSEQKEEGGDGKSTILQRAKLYLMQTMSRLSAQRKGDASENVSLQSTASQPDQA